MRLHRILGLALLAAALPAIASAQKTTYDFDKSAPFGRSGPIQPRSARRPRTSSSTSASWRPSRHSSPPRA